MMTNLVRKLFLPAAAVLACANASAQPSCGGTIVSDTTLSSDLLACPGRGLRIGAGNLTLDCGGHTIEALGNRVVEVVPGVDGVTITRCMLVGSAGTDAVRIGAGTGDITVIGNHITTSGTSGNGIRALGTTGSLISGNTISTSGLNANGVRMRMSADNAIEGNTITTTGESSRGVRLQSESVNNTIAGNFVHTTGVGAVGVLLRAGADANLVQGNVLRTDHSQPIRIESSSLNVLDDNSLRSSTGWLLSRRFPLQNGGMSVHPDGRLFAVENTFGGDFDVGTVTALMELDPSTGEPIVVKRLTFLGADPDFGFDAMEIMPDGRFVAIRGGGSPELYEIDPSTGEVTFLLVVTDGFGFDIGANGLESTGPMTLLATTNFGALVHIDLATASAHFVGFSGVGWTDIAVDPVSGMAYATSRHVIEASQSNHLYRIDAATGSILEEIGDTGVAFLSDIDFASDGTLYGNGAAVLVIDPATADTEQRGGFGEDPFEPPSEMNVLTRTTMVAADGSGSVHYPGAVEPPDGIDTNVSTSVLEISFNRVFVDAAGFPFLDRPATATLLGLPGESRALLVDEDDNGTFEDCDASRCALVSFAGGALVFDVTGFSTYSSRTCASGPGNGPGDAPPGLDGNGPPALCGTQVPQAGAAPGPGGTPPP